MLAACALLAACAGSEPVAYTGIASAPYLRPNPQGDSSHIPYLYSNHVDWTKYAKAIVEPVEIYQGSDNQFGETSNENRASLAKYMQTQFAEKLATRFRITDTPGADTLRIKLTLTGAATSTPVLSTLARFDMAGGVYNGVQAVRGQDGAMTGWVMYAVEIHDAATNQLLEAFVTRKYPGAYNIGATIGTLAAAKTGIDKGADTLVAQLK